LPLARAPRDAGLVTDYDGTLARIVSDPADAMPLEASLAALRALTPMLGVVAVVSGRPVEFLRARLPIDGIALVGQYGLERLVDGEVVLDPRVAAHLDAIAAAAADAERRWPALLIERKGQVAVTIHWRTAPGSEPTEADLRALADGHGLVLQRARMACELRPPVPVDKGTAFRDVVGHEHVGATLAYAGDDDGDVAAFRAGFGAPGHELPPARIAVWSPETPVELLEQADVVVNGPEGLADLLGELADAVSSFRQL
jgi:trehalose 6-phosphate phosphatase